VEQVVIFLRLQKKTFLNLKTQVEENRPKQDLRVWLLENLEVLIPALTDFHREIKMDGTATPTELA
jgi:hypothetical protein